MHVVPIPAKIADDLAAGGTRRVLGEIKGHSFARAIQGAADSERYLMFGQVYLREMGLKLGDAVAVEIWPDPNPDVVEISEEFAAVLEQDEAAAKRWNEEMTPGKQRSLAVYVDGAKRSETRLKRALEVAEKLRTYTLYGD